MNRNILFIIDDTELENFEFNDLVTDFWLIKEFLKRGSRVCVCPKNALFIENAQAHAIFQESYLKEENIFCCSQKKRCRINDFDVVFFRPDPPVDINYINACSILSYADSSKTLFINNPCAVKNFNEKLNVNDFIEFMPENIVTSSYDLIADFVSRKKEAVLKPLNRCFGSGVYYLNIRDKNLPSIISGMTENGAVQVMVQEYLKEAAEGDKRVLIIGDFVLSECIQKLPAENNFKFAVHSDKYFKKTALTIEERRAAEITASKLAAQGLYLAGLDVINGKVIEINVTSPCYFIREINNNYGIHFEDTIMKHLEALIEKHFDNGRLYAAAK